jgi:hypothetical protein
MTLSRIDDKWGERMELWYTGFIPEFESDPEMKNKLLPKLLPFNTGLGQGLENFKLIYRDESDYILIYQIKL